MNFDEFRRLVERMRTAQVRYFRFKDNLDECKGLERLVDKELAALKAGPDLFSAQPGARNDP